MIVKHNKGVTLIELLIVMVIAVVLVGGIYALFMTQQRSYFVQDRVAGIQQDARVALDLMARDIRMAGFQSGPGSDEGFNEIILYGDDYDADPSNDCYYAVGGGSSSIRLVTATDTGVRVREIKENDQHVYLVAGSYSSGSLFEDEYVAFEGLNKIYVIKEVDDADPVNPTITLTNSMATPSPTLNPPDHLDNFDEARIYRVGTTTYNISGNALQRDGQPLAGDGVTTVVEDLQLAYQLDDENWYSSAASFPTHKTAADIRMVRITISVRTAVPDPEDASNRQRDYTTLVKVRNL